MFSVTSALRSWLLRLPKQTRTILLTTIYGLGAGLAAVAFQAAMSQLYQEGLVKLAKQSGTVFLLGSLALMLGGGLVAGWLMNSFCREAAGSGIPQLKAAFWKDFGHVPFRVAWVKFIAGAIQIGTGSSLGREGPSVQLAGTVASNLAGLAGEPKQKRRQGAATGAAAGLAAAFNTPLAAVTFALEEIIGDLNSRLLGSILLAGMLGALVTHGLLGPQPAFQLEPLGEPQWRSYLIVPLVAAVAGLVGVAFQRGALGLRALSQRWKPIPPWTRPAIGALICWALGVAVFFHGHTRGHLGVFGLGYGDLTDALAGKLAWDIAAVLLFTKFIATVSCYGTGGCGGIFSPNLFFGAMVGVCLSGLVNHVLPLAAGDKAVLAVVGMSATLGAVVRAPVTSVLIVFEMTHEFALVPPLMLGALVSQALSRRLLRHNFYDALLEQDGHDLDRFVPPRDLRAWQEQPASALANRNPVIADSLKPEALERLMEAYPYQRFPVVEAGALRGFLERAEVRAALKEKREPRLAEAVLCSATASLREVQERLMESPTGMVLLQNWPSGPVEGLLTLHDLLRAEMAAAERAGDDAG